MNALLIGSLLVDLGHRERTAGAVQLIAAAQFLVLGAA